MRPSLALAVLITGVAGHMQAQQVVFTAGAESGDLSGWTQVASQGFCPSSPQETITVASIAHTGNFSYAFTGVDCIPFMQTTIPTIPGHQYAVDFWAMAQGGDPASYINGPFPYTGEPSEAIAGVSGQCLNTIGLYSPNLGWVHGTGCPYFPGGPGVPGTLTPLTIGGYNNFGTMYIDDIQVTDITPGDVSTTPEPSSLALLGTGLVGLVPLVRRKKR